MGISLQGLVTAGKKFIYNEVAIGGGVSECGNVTAVQPWQVRAAGGPLVAVACASPG